MRISYWSSDVCSSDLIAAELRLYVGKGEAEQARGFAELFDRILDQLSIVPVAGLHRQHGLQHFGLEIAQAALDVDLAELVAFAFLDHIGDDEVLLVARQLGDRGDDAEIGIAVLQVKQADLLLVIGEAVGIIGRVRRQDGQKPTLRSEENTYD